MARVIFCVAVISSLLLMGCIQATTHNAADEFNVAVQPLSENEPPTIWKASATLRPVDEEANSAGGFVEIDVRNDLTFVPTVRLNLPPLTEGHYEAWLSRDDPPASINIGPLIQENENGSYHLGDTTIKLTDDLRKFSTVSVMAGDESVLKGTLVVVSGMRLDGLDELFGSFDE